MGRVQQSITRCLQYHGTHCHSLVPHPFLSLSRCWLQPFRRTLSDHIRLGLELAWSFLPFQVVTGKRSGTGRKDWSRSIARGHSKMTTSAHCLLALDQVLIRGLIATIVTQAQLRGIAIGSFHALGPAPPSLPWGSHMLPAVSKGHSTHRGVPRSP